MRFDWDEHKNRLNLRKHEVTFESAALVFDDPHAITKRDIAFDDEERWITTGAIGPGAILVVVHTYREEEERKLRASSRLVLLDHKKGEPMRKLTKQQKRDIRAIAAKRDEDINYSDIPPVLDWSGAEIGKFYRPGKKPVTIRLDSDVIAWLKSDGRGYQTRANQLLRHAMTHLRKQANAASASRIGRKKRR